MNILFAAYCMLDNENGDSLIGVFKRCLRLGLEMHSRAHEVHIFCTGPRHLRDPLVETAARRLHSFDVPPGVQNLRSTRLRRRLLRALVARARLDLIVIGEVPLCGILLDFSLVAAELEIPVVLLDNAYSPRAARRFLHRHGHFFDGVILTGLSSFQPRPPEPFFCPVPPFLTGDPDAALPQLHTLGLTGQSFIVVLAYERKAETLALNLLQSAAAAGPDPAHPPHFLFLSPHLDGTALRLAALPADLRARAHILAPPSEAVLFSLLHHAAIAIGKCGFMQVSESLGLGTPFLAVEYRGCFSPQALPARARQFLHASPDVVPDAARLSAFTRFLQLDRAALRPLHDGHFDALPRAARFLEALPRTPRPGLTAHAVREGYTLAAVTAALRQRHHASSLSTQPLVITRLRCMRLDDLPFGRADTLAVTYRLGPTQRFACLTGRRYWSVLFGRRLLRRALAATAPEAILYRAPNGRFSLEDATLPPAPVSPASADSCVRSTSL